MEPIAQSTVAWITFGIYLVVTAGLAVIGWLKTDSLESFAVGKRDMGPWLVGITMGASLSSTATFVINPGFVYTHGVSAFMHLGVAVGLGLAVALYVLSPRFRRIGVDGKALTLPHWIGARYGSTALRVVFGLISLMSIAFLVLIAGSVQILLQTTLELSPQAALLLTIGFVFSYILIGGTYAHTYTNTLQGVMMLFVTVVILVKAFGALTADGFLATVEAHGPELLAAVNPKSSLYGDVFSVYIAGFVIGFAIVCQPHLLMKALYLERDEDVNRYVTITVCITALFFLLLLAGLAAHATFDPASGPTQDTVMVLWLKDQFGPIPFVLISVALVAAGMSTLDGILVAMSTVMSNDVFLPVAERTFLAHKTPEQRARVAYRFGQASLIAMGVVTWLILSGDKPKLLGIFGQTGVYGIVAAGVGPILIGVLLPGRKDLRPLALTISIVGFAVYATLNGINYTLRSSPEGTLAKAWSGFADGNPIVAGLIAHPNPAVPATISILLCAFIAAVWLATTRRGAAV
ncbi:MAG: hypothetical protein H6703_12940 [Myxococcales bacterium]|nr:hypothetical protein [Myxococcales bacterium]MCB9553247.1 hypothetical protein [Myxococcales bacterium]